jgi:hypothetical protein
MPVTDRQQIAQMSEFMLTRILLKLETMKPFQISKFLATF